MVNGLILTVHSPFLLDFIAAHLFAALTLAQVLANFPAGHTAKFRLTNLKFKSIAYRALRKIMDAGALGAEIRMGGKLPGDRAKSLRFAEGYLKKTGEPSKVVDSASRTALTKLGITGIKVKILSPDAEIHDRINITPELILFVNREIDKPAKEKKKAKQEKK